MILLLSCEHAVNTIPPDFAPYFAKAKAALDSHRGIDFGAVDCARYLREKTNAPCLMAQTSRLLIDLNRSLTHPDCFSEFTKPLPQNLRDQLVRTYYQPYRQAIEKNIRDLITTGQIVLHLSVHSFTPILHGKVRTADLGLLYDARRPLERDFASTWQTQLKIKTGLSIRKNYPYLGRADGLTTALRRLFPEDKYLGVELEMNQQLVGQQTTFDAVKKAIAATLVEILISHPHGLFL